MCTYWIKIGFRGIRIFTHKFEKKKEILKHFIVITRLLIHFFPFNLSLFTYFLSKFLSDCLINIHASI